MVSNLYEEDSNESVWNPELQELRIDLSALLNSPCTVILTGWKMGIVCRVIVDGETEYYNAFDPPLFPIEFVGHQCLKPWLATIPTKVITLIRRYNDYGLSMLMMISRNKSALNLFLDHPSPFWQLFRHAVKNGWTEQQFLIVCKQEALEILRVCKLPPTTTALKVLNNIGEPYGLNQQLIQFLLRHPRWLDSELMVNWQSQSIPRLLVLVYSIKQLAGILRLDCTDLMQQVYDCPNLESVELLHGQLLKRRTNQLMWIAMDDNKSALDNTNHFFR